VTFADPESRTQLGAERIEGELLLAPTQALEIVPRLFGLATRIEAGTIVLEEANG
jgi:hypothetical protein